MIGVVTSICAMWMMGISYVAFKNEIYFVGIVSMLAGLYLTAHVGALYCGG